MRKTTAVLLFSLMATGAIAKDEPTKLVTAESKTSTVAKDDPTKWVTIASKTGTTWKIDPTSFHVKVEKAETYAFVTSRMIQTDPKSRDDFIAMVRKSECERGKGHVEILTTGFLPVRRDAYSFNGGSIFDGFAEGLCTVLKSRS